jgi:hypothetical protein
LLESLVISSPMAKAIAGVENNASNAIGHFNKLIKPSMSRVSIVVSINYRLMKD